MKTIYSTFLTHFYTSRIGQIGQNLLSPLALRQRNDNVTVKENAETWCRTRFERRFLLPVGQDGQHPAGWWQTKARLFTGNTRKTRCFICGCSVCICGSAVEADNAACNCLICGCRSKRSLVPASWRLAVFRFYAQRHVHGTRTTLRSDGNRLNVILGTNVCRFILPDPRFYNAVSSVSLIFERSLLEFNLFAKRG